MEEKTKSTLRPGAGRPPTPEDEQCRRGKITSYYSPNRIDQLREAAKQTGMSVAGTIRFAVYDWLDNRNRAA